MMLFHRILTIAKASFFERIRRSSFLITVMLTIVATYFLVPASNSNYGVLMISGYRGIYNSAWLGMSVSMSVLSTLSLIGFILIKNAVDQDRLGHLDQIICSSNISKTIYLIGKFISNLFTLLSLIGIMFVITLFMQLLRKESYVIVLSDILLPLLIVVVPALFLISGFGILFESIPFLNSGLGNIIYFFLWGISLNLTHSLHVRLLGKSFTLSSPLGFELLMNPIIHQFSKAYPNAKIELSDGIIELTKPLQTFPFSRIDWTSSMILSRGLWIILSFLLLIIASFFFKGFDSKPTKRIKVLNPKVIDYKSIPRYITPQMLTPVKHTFSYYQVISLELKLLLKGQKWWWYLLQSTFIILSIVAPSSLVKSTLGPLGLCCPLLILSTLGVREYRNNMQQIIHSCPNNIRKQSISIWISGFFLCVISSSGVMINFLLSHNYQQLLFWINGCVFLTSLACFCGFVTHTNRSFEFTFLVFIFMGILNKQKMFDFLGVIKNQRSFEICLLYTLLSILLIATSFTLRKKQPLR